MESLTLHQLTPSPTALAKFCEAMPHITKLILPCRSHGDHDNTYDGVLRAIAAHMPHLKCLDISYCTIEPKSIEYLLPTEDNILGGCPELIELHLMGIVNLSVQLLKKIILALPRLRSLKHKLLVDALGDLTEEEMGENTARYLLRLYMSRVMVNNSNSHIHQIRLANSPAFQRLKNTITTAEIHVPNDVQNHLQSEQLIADMLLSMQNIRTIIFCSAAEDQPYVLPMLESIGDHLKNLHLLYMSEISVKDIMNTCQNLETLTLYHWNKANDSLLNSENNNHAQVEKSCKLPFLKCLTLINIWHMDKQVCNADIFIALLQSPNLNKITLLDLEIITDDVMFNVLSSRDCAALSKVTQCCLFKCPFITAAPFVYWLSKGNCSLQHLRFRKCEKIDRDVLVDAARKYHRALIIEENYV